MELKEYGRIIENDSSSGRFVSADPNKCSGCGICELVCALKKENLFDPSLSRIKVVRLLGLVNLTSACVFCENAPCVEACPRQALLSSEKKIIKVDTNKCNGCGWCIQACKYGAIRLHPEKTSVLICDLCEGDPECIKWCPEGALDLRSMDSFNRILKQTLIKKLLG